MSERTREHQRQMKAAKTALDAEQQAIAQQLMAMMALRESLLAAFLAETGKGLSQCDLMVKQSANGEIVTWVEAK